MFWNGAAIGTMKIITKIAQLKILKDPIMVTPVFFAVAAGTAMLRAAVHRIATAMSRRISTTPWVFGWLRPCSEMVCCSTCF